MRHIRKWVYRMGFRPKPGSIFFSPSRAYLPGHDAFQKGLVESLKERSK